MTQPCKCELQEAKQASMQAPEGRLESHSCHAPAPYRLPALQQPEAVGPGSSSQALSSPVPTPARPHPSCLEEGQDGRMQWVQARLMFPSSLPGRDYMVSKEDS